MFIQYRVRLVLIYMRVAIFKIRLLRKSVSNIAVTRQNIGAATATPAPTRLNVSHFTWICYRFCWFNHIL